MRPCLSVLLCGLFATTISTSVGAMPTGEEVKMTPGAFPMDCAKAQDKERCAILNKRIETCRDKTDDAWRQCMDRPAAAANFTPPKPRDCSKAQNKETCAAHTSALKACEDKRTRAEHRQCMAEQMRIASTKKD